MEVVCGIDIGTTNIKAMAVAPAGGGTVAVEHVRTPVACDAWGPVHEPSQIVAAVLACLRRLLDRGPFKVLAVAVSSVGEEGVPLGEDMEPLYPAIAWYDGRTGGLFDRLCTGPEREFFRRLTGLVPGPEYTLFKLLWLREQGVGPVHRWLALSDYVSWFLSGEMALAVSQACRTMVFNLAGRSLDEGVLDRFALSRGLFPAVRNGGEVLGPMRREAAAQLGLDHLPLMVVGGHDHVVGAFGLNLDEEILDSKGTAEALMCSLSRFDAGDLATFPHIGCGVAADGTQYYALAALRSGAGLAQAARLLGTGDAAGLVREAAGGRPGCGGLRYRPPHHGSSASICGLADGQGPGDLARSFLEGWAFLLRFLVGQVEDLAGRSFGRVIVCGGGAHAGLGAAIQAAVLDRPLRPAGNPEAAALGACRLAARGLGLPDTWYPAADEDNLIRPKPDWVEVYDGIYLRDYLAVLGDRGGR